MQPPLSHTTAAILSVGDELTLGQTLDTNSRWLADRLTALCILPLEHVTVPDDLDAHVDALRRLAQRADCVICTGGLGPTSDDLTREALARAMGDTLIEDSLALAQIETWYAARGRSLTPLSRVQALRPSRAVTLPNLHGTAPGIAGRISVGDRECDVFCLPGPPREMHPMFESIVRPRLSPPAGRTIRTRVLHTFGLAESDIAERLGSLMDRSASPLVGTTASGGVVSVRMRYEGTLAPIDADALLDTTESKAREGVGAYVFASGEGTLVTACLALLRERRETFGVVESCTGGLLGQLVTDVAGSSASFAGGLITYSNALKQSLANVPESHFAPAGVGAVSPETARAMAVGGLQRLACDHALAITGIAGPGGGTPEKPVGLVCIARASRNASDVDVRTFRMLGDRASIREWSARSALAMLWQHLAGLPAMPLLRQVV